MDEMRKQFENWWEVTQHNGNPPHKGWDHWRDGDGYGDDSDELHFMWIGWQASRTTLPVAYMTHHGSAVSPDDFADGEEEMHQAAKTEGWTPLIAGVTGGVN